MYGYCHEYPVGSFRNPFRGECYLDPEVAGPACGARDVEAAGTAAGHRDLSGIGGQDGCRPVVGAIQELHCELSADIAYQAAGQGDAYVPFVPCVKELGLHEANLHGDGHHHFATDCGVAHPLVVREHLHEEGGQLVGVGERELHSAVGRRLEERFPSYGGGEIFPDRDFFHITSVLVSGRSGRFGDCHVHRLLHINGVVEHCALHYSTAHHHGPAAIDSEPADAFVHARFGIEIHGRVGV